MISTRRRYPVNAQSPVGAQSDVRPDQRSDQRWEPGLAPEWRIPNAGTVAAVEAPTIPVELLDRDEIVIAVIPPSPWLVPISAAGTLGAIALAILVFVWSARMPGVPWSEVQAAVLGAMAMTVRLVWGALDWASRLYVLTDRRVMQRSGVVRPVMRDLPLRELHHVGVLASSRERALGIGTIVLASGATGETGADLLWESLRRPEEVQRLVREAASRYR